MAIKVDQATVVTTSAAITSSSKVSMFSAKSGFVIPKNKLSGSLVPVFRCSGKSEASDATKEESSKQIQRKTKWGTDLTQDAAVRRGRALAYQTRVEQITQQLKSGVLKTGEAQASVSPSQVLNCESSDHQINDKAQKIELLELERREIIGEILKLNPSYKAPSDYKPLLKEAVVPIPLKAHPGFNFIGLLLGSGRNTLKRLEEAEITRADGDEVQNAYEELYVHVSADTHEKVDAAVALIELLVRPVSVNSAVVSTTPTSVSGDTVITVEQSQGLVTSYVMPGAIGNQGVLQPMIGSSQPGPPQVQFRPYPSPWFPLGPTQTSIQSPSAFISLPNSSLPMPNNLVQISPPPRIPSNNPPFFARFTPGSGFGSVSGNHPSLATRPQPSMPTLQWPYMHDTRPASHISPINNLMPVSQPLSAYPTASAQPNLTVPPAFTGNQHTPAGPVPVARQLVPQPFSSGPLPNRPLTPAGSSGGWSGVPAIIPRGIGNTVQMTSSMVPPQRPHSMVQPNASVALPNISATVMSRPAPNVVPPASFPSLPHTPQLVNTSAVNRPAPTPGFVSVPAQVGSSPVSLASSQPSVSVPVSSQTPGRLPAPSMAGHTQIPPAILPRAPVPIFAQASGTIPASAAASIQSTSPVPHVQPVNLRAPVRNPLQNPVVGSSTVSSPVPSTSPQQQSGMPIGSGSLPSFTPMKPPVTSPGSIPPVTTPKPQRPSSGDFTFQPLRSQHPAAQTVPRSSGQPPTQSTPPVLPPLAPQSPSFRPALHSLPQPGIQSFARPQAANPIGQPHAPSLTPSPGSIVPFGGNPPTTSLPPRPLVFPSSHPIRPSTPVPQMRPQSFGSASHMPPIPSVLPLRPANPLQQQQNQLSQTIRPGNLLFPNQQFNNNLSFASGKPASGPGGNQIYDPFSPTSVPSAPPRQGDSPAKVRKQENDPEYEDLMDSVGVR
ncbi:extensin isoform X2 [Macadamia integrifolia]|uniref:extensin isoform X2 n=1 Tax=Macadamia integrifolia TaxID=60698 RepID=UPI001C4ED6BE|nr:extensin isoform X2 [Macadamia integrifolia]